MAITTWIRKTTAFSVRTGGVLGAIAGITSDVLMPIADFGLYISGISVVILFILIVANVLFGKIISRKVEAFTGPEDNFWFAPLAFSVLLMSALTGGAYLLGSSQSPNNGPNPGFIASHIPIVEKLQIQTGILEAQLVEQKRTNEHLGDLKSIAEQELALSQEQVRQNEAHNNSPETLVYSFYTAILNGDVETIKSIVKNPGWNNKYLFKNSIQVNLIELLIETENDNNISVLKHLIKVGAWDPNQISTLNYNSTIRAQNFFKRAISTPIYQQREKASLEGIQGYKAKALKEAGQICYHYQDFTTEFDQYVQDNIYTKDKPRIDYQQNWGEVGIPKEVIALNPVVRKYHKYIDLGPYNICASYQVSNLLRKSNSGITQLQGLEMGETICDAYDEVDDKLKKQAKEYSDYLKKLAPTVKMEKEFKLDQNPRLSPYKSQLMYGRCDKNRIYNRLISEFENKNKPTNNLRIKKLQASGYQMAYLLNNQGVIRLLEQHSIPSTQHLLITDSEENVHSFGITKDI